MHMLAILPLLADLRRQKKEKAKEARAIFDAVKEGEEMTEEQQSRFDSLMNEVDTLSQTIERRERLATVEEELEARTPVQSAEAGADPAAEPEERGAPAEPEAPEVRAGKDRKRRAKLAHLTLKMLNGVATRNFAEINRTQREIAAAGWYGEEMQQRAAGDYYSTAVDADGAILLPTVVVQEIEDIAEVVGMALQACTVFNHIVGTLKVPGGSGNLHANFVAEGGVITSSMRSFAAVALNPQKLALIIPWTYEANLEAGPQILADAQRKIATGFAYSIDNALFNGDGTATFNSIDGIFSTNRTGVASYVLPAGSVDFTDLSADDIFDVRVKIPASLRAMAAYAFHPDMEPTLRKLKDGDGRYLFAFNEDRGVTTLGGRPLYYTEVLPDAAATDVSTTFGCYGYFPAMKIAVGEGMTSEEMREGTVKDADTAADINLATQDLRALKVRQFVDMDMNFEEGFCEITTAAA